MKNSTLTALVLGIVSGLLFSLGMCMVLLPEWNLFVEGIGVGVAVMAMLVVTDKMSADDCYAITKALYSNLDRIKASHNVGNLITKESARDGMSLTLNPGAEKFFNE